VPDYDSGAQRVDNVLIIWMKKEPVIDVSFIRRNVPEKPMTALI